MNKKNRRKAFLFAVLFFGLILLGGSYFFTPVKNVVHAEDDDDREDEDEDEYEDDEVQAAPVVVQEVGKEESKPVETKQTIKEPDRVVTTTMMETVTLVDSDKDGLIDSEDPHPQIAEIYIVNDDNKNGIADWLEGGK